MSGGSGRPGGIPAAWSTRHPTVWPGRRFGRLFDLGGWSRALLCALLVLGAAPASATDEGPAVEATRQAIERVDTWNDRLAAVIAVNPSAMEEAARLDRERAAGQVRGRLHGIPVLIKDNIETREQVTTAGSLALANNRTGRDSAVVARLRENGLVILGKANLSEWANFRSERSSSGWSAVGGQARNPYDTLRSPCGSSSGSAVAVAAGMVPLAVGTETNGSVVCPASVNGIVGIKPTVGLVSRRGVVPISHSQDTPGPMATNVRDAAWLLNAMAGPDPEDPTGPAPAGVFERDYSRSLKADGLRGKRVGVVRSLAGFHEGVDANLERAVDDLAAAGAEVVDNLEFPEAAEDFEDAAYDLLLMEFKHDLNTYLAGISEPAGERTLQSLIEFNRQHVEQEMKWFRQEIFVKAQEADTLESDHYRETLARVQDFSRAAIDNLLEEHQLDLLVAPTDAPAWSIDLIDGDHFLGGSSSMPARAGYPHITVPMGFVHGLPVGLSFFSTAWSEPVLIEAAYGYEQATGRARPPQGFGDWRPAVSE